MNFISCTSMFGTRLIINTDHIVNLVYNEEGDVTIIFLCTGEDFKLKGNRMNDFGKAIIANKGTVISL